MYLCKCLKWDRNASRTDNWHLYLPQYRHCISNFYDKHICFVTLFFLNPMLYEKWYDDVSEWTNGSIGLFIHPLHAPPFGREEKSHPILNKNVNTNVAVLLHSLKMHTHRAAGKWRYLFNMFPTSLLRLCNRRPRPVTHHLVTEVILAGAGTHFFVLS